jgi:divIVA domain protein
MKGNNMLITPKEVRDAQISTRFFGTGYDMEETDKLLDNCEHTIEVVGAHCVELQSALLTMKRLLEAHNIPIPQTI